MKSERTILMPGKQYQYIKGYLETNAEYPYHTGSEFEPEVLRVSEIYLDTDPDFTRNPAQFAKVDEDLEVQVKIVYEEE